MSEPTPSRASAPTATHPKTTGQLPARDGQLPPSETTRRWPAEHEILERAYSVGDRPLRAVVEHSNGRLFVHLVTTLDAPLVLHWGLCQPGAHGWRRPPESWVPAESTMAGDAAAESPFRDEDGVRRLDLSLPAEEIPPGGSVGAVLHRPGTGHWFKDAGRDLQIPLTAPRPVAGASSSRTHAIAARIVEQETGAGSWTLMHRFELCHELLEQAGTDEDALAVLFVWMRYSALRQLDWQRHYNTQPRRLTHAQDRLTRRIAELWRREPRARSWALRLMSTLGRGGEGQRVRDDILALMHRHQLKEVTGTFVEQWHQKLHNNTTPDDIAICDAFIAFLRSKGDLATFHARLAAHGVTRERLASYDRPITIDPALPPCDVEALAADFERYLGLLRSVHDSTDLSGALANVADRLDPKLVEQLRELVRPDTPAETPLDTERALEAARGAAEKVASALAQLVSAHRAAEDDGLLRDLIYLDLALLEHLRRAVEGISGARGSAPVLCSMLAACLSTLAIDGDAPELAACAAHWQRLSLDQTPPDRERALHGRSVVERLTRWVSAESTALVSRLAPMADTLGRELGVEEGVRAIFAEEVVRGGPLFALGSLLGQTDAALRAVAGVGAWQLVSPGSAAGELCWVPRLLDVQGQRFERESVILAEHVEGQEEVPDGVSAVITTSDVDLLSHLAVRARDTGVLLATLWDPETLERLRQLAGRKVRLDSTPAGDVVVSIDEGGGRAATPNTARRSLTIAPVNACGRVLEQDDFAAGAVGAKARVLAELRRTLPAFIEVPASVALAFGTFERALADPANQALHDELTRLSAELDPEPPRTLAALRAAVGRQGAPRDLLAELAEVSKRAGIEVPDLEAAWSAIKRVWASRWNDRAYFARRARGVSEDQVHVAVLVQEVVEADYAFVLHTRNPLGDSGELLGEMVVGMGEALVGNYPGRAFGFVCDKRTGALRVVSYPSKSAVLRASGLIFRSDSNAEDLEGFAGAGLFDSVTAAPMRESPADYRDEPLLWDTSFQREVTWLLTRVGVEVERARGAPQDVEGVLHEGRPVVVQSRPQVGP